MNKADKMRKNILLAAMDEFSEHGFIQASTNQIAKRAEVSKGIIFHYFENKKQLYLSCLNHVIEVFDQYMAEHSSYLKHMDIFDKMLSYDYGKYQFYLAYEKYNAILYTTYNLPEGPEYKDIKEVLFRYSNEAWSKFLNNIDTSQIRDELDKDKTIQYVAKIINLYSTNLTAPYQKNYLEAFKDYEELFNEVKDIVEMLKFGVCKRQ